MAPHKKIPKVREAKPRTKAEMNNGNPFLANLDVEKPYGLRIVYISSTRNS